MIRLTDEDFQEFCNLMNGNYGIGLKKKRVLIEYRMLEQLKECNMDSFHEYLLAMKEDQSGNLKQIMVDQLTTNYTYFCREMEHYHFIQKNILPALDTSVKEYKTLVAGCSSGQECYTLMMIMEDYRRAGNRLPNVMITGCDINRQVLQTAKQGTYPITARQELSEEWQKKYTRLNKDNRSFQILPQLFTKLQFVYQNLLQPFKNTHYHMIMCRNVMIYFNESSRKKLLGIFYQILVPGGYLILGHSEVLPKIPEGFRHCGSSIYQKQVD